MRLPRVTFSAKATWRIRFSLALFPLCMTAITLPAQTFTTLHSFYGPDGANPTAGLIQGIDGNLYGTTSAGGAKGDGTVFEISPSRAFTTVFSFDGTDGAAPIGTVFQVTGGNFYGTTFNGGPNVPGGTVFRVTLSGMPTTLYDFCSQTNCADGGNPVAAPVQGKDGNFYGITSYGGEHGWGTVFKITPSGTMTTLYNFCSQSSCTDGSSLSAGLLLASNGSLYGTTTNGGAFNRGTIFKVSPSGTLTTLLSFDVENGAYPFAGLIEAANGNFYGTTSAGGAGVSCGNGGCGTAFEITPSGTLTTLYTFCSQSECPDGTGPEAGLIQASDGNFYGTTAGGGTHDRGTIFRITPSGTLTTLYNFCPLGGECIDGKSPQAGLFQATNGKFYGTMPNGGLRLQRDGTVFSLDVGLGPFVETLPTSGKVGAPVKILGTNLTGATSVTFNGTAATFKEISPSEITTTVPAGATTGQVQVATPTQTLTSNKQFLVL